MSLDPDVASKIQAMYLDREMSAYAPKSSKSRAIVPVYCRHQLWSARKHAFSKLGVPCISGNSIFNVCCHREPASILCLWLLSYCCLCLVQQFWVKKLEVHQLLDENIGEEDTVYTDVSVDHRDWSDWGSQSESRWRSLLNSVEHFLQHEDGGGCNDCRFETAIRQQYNITFTGFETAIRQQY